MDAPAPSESCSQLGFAASVDRMLSVSGLHNLADLQPCPQLRSGSAKQEYSSVFAYLFKARGGGDFVSDSALIVCKCRSI